MKKIEDRRGVWVANTCRLFMDCTVVLQAGNCPWGIGLRESWHVHTHTYMHSYRDLWAGKKRWQGLIAPMCRYEVFWTHNYF
jgi:hypothetical protein